MPDIGTNPNISLGIQTPQAGGPNLGTLSGFADLQNKINQNQQFQQTFMARQKAGQIIASASTPEEGMAALLKDPQVAPFAGSIINEFKAGLLSTAQYQGEVQKQAQSGLTAGMGAMIAGISDPSQLKPAINAQLATLSPLARGKVQPAMESLVTSLLTNLPKDPTAAKQVYANRVAGLGISAGVTPASLEALVGKPQIADTGGALNPGVQLPAQLGGGFQPSGPGVGKTLAPQITEVPSPSGAMSKAIVGGMAGSGGLGLPSSAGGPGGPTSSLALGTGPSNEQKDYSTNRGHDMADYAKNLDQDVSTSAGIVRVVAEARKAQEMFSSGGGADTYKSIAQIAQGLGVDPKTVDKIANGNLGSVQEFDKLMNQTTMGQIKSQLPEGSRLAQSEFKVFTEKNPNIETDPRAIEKVFNFWTSLYKQKSDEQTSFNDYANKPGTNLGAWPAKWNQVIQDKGYIHPELTNNTGADYPTTDAGKAAMVKDFKAGKLTRAQASNIARIHGWAN